MKTGKRFKLRTGHIITVDETDAYIMRTIVWVGMANGAGRGVTVKRLGGGSSALGAKLFLSHYLAGEIGKPCVIHLDGDSTNFRRSNLKAVTQEEANQHIGKCLAAGRAAKKKNEALQG